jgi:aminoglycoside phosphotransferase (APT) family kinase protein
LTLPVVDTVPAPRHDAAVEAELGKYLSDRIAGSDGLTISSLARIPGGASRETWMFDASWSANGKTESAAFVLRKDPPASLVESDREVEYAFYSAFEETSVPVPRMCWLEKDLAYLGAPFFIMERILGCDSNTRRIHEPDYNDSRAAIARELYEVLAAIHHFDWRRSAIEQVVAAPEPGDCWRRELDYWEGMIDANELSPQPIARAAIRWLRSNPPPPPQRVTVVHGDYRVGNFLYRPDGIHGIVDWEMAHLGDPMEDLAWSFMEAWEWMRDGRKGGIIDAEEAIQVYEHATGQTVDRDALHWWDVFSGVKAQGIWLTGARSFSEGRTGELMMPFTAYWLSNFQDEILLRSMGRGA